MEDLWYNGYWFPYNGRTKNEDEEVKVFYSSSASRPGMYSKLTSNITGLLGATLGLPGAEVRPFGNASCNSEEIQNQRKPDVRKSHIRIPDKDSVTLWQTHAKEKDTNACIL